MELTAGVSAGRLEPRRYTPVSSVMPRDIIIITNNITTLDRSNDFRVAAHWLGARVLAQGPGDRGPTGVMAA